MHFSFRGIRQTWVLQWQEYHPWQEQAALLLQVQVVLVSEAVSPPLCLAQFGLLLLCH
jgi:hypothetical protein